MALLQDHVRKRRVGRPPAAYCCACENPNRCWRHVASDSLRTPRTWLPSFTRERTTGILFCHGIAPFSRGHPGREHGRAMRRRTSHLPFFFPNHEKRFCRHNQFQVLSRSQGQQKLAPIASKRQRRGTGAGKEGSSCEKATPIFPWLRQVRVAPSKPAQVSFAIRRRFVRQAGSNDIRPTLSHPGFRGLQHDWRGTEDQSRARMRTGKAMSENTEN